MSERPPVTKMTHLLPFDSLSPLDFERLCLWLVEREGYEQAEALGEAGSEQGRDIVGWREGRRVAFQCKRVRQFGPKSARVEIEKLQALPADEEVDELIFIVTCAVSAKTRKVARTVWAKDDTCHFWAGHELDEKVKRHPEILRQFFDLGATEPAVEFPQAADARRLLAQYPELEKLELACRQGDATEAMAGLRKILVGKLRALSSAKGYESPEDTAPMSLLRRLVGDRVLAPEVHRGLEYALTVTSEVLYDRTVSRSEGTAAVIQTAMALHSLREANAGDPAFQVELRSSGFFFTFRVGERTILRSELYKSRAALMNGIRSVRRLVAVNRFQEAKAKTGQPFFRLIAPNGEIVAISKLFGSAAAMRDAMAIVTRHVPSAEVIDVGSEDDSVAAKQPVGGGRTDGRSNRPR